MGNIPLVLRESLLPRVLDYGIRFVEETRRSLPPGVIGPFSLEGVIDDEANIRIFEFSGRIVAGTNLYVYGSPYSYLYWGEPMSMVGGLLGRLGWPLRGTSSIGWSHEVQRWELTEWLQAWRGFSAHSSIASHSALDVFDGAKDEGFRTVAVCQRGRETAYLRFKRVVDVPLILDKYATWLGRTSWVSSGR